MRHSQSNLSSLATLLQNAEARHSATPPPLPLEAAKEDDSGLIDILAMQKRAREERALGGVVTKTPVPVVTAVRSATTDPDFVASLAKSKRRTKRFAIGVVASVALLLAVAIGVKSARHGTAAAHAPPALPPVAVQPAPPPLAAPPVAIAPAPPLPVVAAAPDPAPPAAAPSGKGKKGHKSSHSKSKGPKLTKVTSSGVPN